MFCQMHYLMAVMHGYNTLWSDGQLDLNNIQSIVKCAIHYLGGGGGVPYDALHCALLNW